MKQFARALVLLLSMTASAWAVNDPAQLMNTSVIRQALDTAKIIEPETIETQIHICQIPAPSFKEVQRGEEMARLFREAHLHNVRTDAAGNVLGDRPGQAAHPHLVVAAHLDTVFPEGTDVGVKRDGTILKGPGIGDDCRGLATLIGVVRSLNHAHVVTTGTITFVADVGEEGLGDLRGMKELFDKTLEGQIDEFLSIDGAAYSISTAGVGSYRYRITFTGPGGHSYGSFGIANPIHALGRAIAKISDFQTPTSPETTFNVGRIGGGISVNSIASECWAEVDLRSEDSITLDALDSKFKQAVQSALDEENQRWNNEGKVILSLEQVGYRPAGRTESSSAIVQSAIAVNQALGLEIPQLIAGSTDSNYPMELGIPAITIGGGGDGTGGHSPDETFHAKDSWVGTQRILLLTVTLVQ